MSAVTVVARIPVACLLEPLGDLLKDVVHVGKTDHLVVVIEVRDLDDDKDISGSLEHTVDRHLKSIAVEDACCRIDDIVLVFDGKKDAHKAHRLEKHREQIKREHDLHDDRNKGYENEEQERRCPDTCKDKAVTDYEIDRKDHVCGRGNIQCEEQTSMSVVPVLINEEDLPVKRIRDKKDKDDAYRCG